MITLKSITVRLGGVPILQDATAAILPGAKVGLTGRNGAGKSTLMLAFRAALVRDLEAAEKQWLEAHGSLERQVA